MQYVVYLPHLQIHPPCQDVVFYFPERRGELTSGHLPTHLKLKCNVTKENL